MHRWCSTPRVSSFCWLENVLHAESNEYPEEVTTKSSLQKPAIFLEWVLAIQFHSKRKLSAMKKGSPSATQPDVFSTKVKKYTYILGP